MEEAEADEEEEEEEEKEDTRLRTTARGREKDLRNLSRPSSNKLLLTDCNLMMP